jgi:hypothetical protein
VDLEENFPPRVRSSEFVIVGKERFRTLRADEGTRQKPSKTHQRFFKAEFLLQSRASVRDRNVVSTKQLAYGVITDIFSLSVGRRDPPWIIIRANWFALAACHVDRDTHNVVVDRKMAWWKTKETMMLASSITAQVLLAPSPGDVNRGVFLDSTPLYPPMELGGVPRLCMVNA